MKKSLLPLIEVAAPTHGVPGPWWPDLYLKKGRLLRQILPEQCGAVMELYRDGRGFSEMPSSSIPLYTITGKRIGHISYNGRVWLDDVDGQEIEIPVAGYKTAAQHEAEGWADCSGAAAAQPVNVLAVPA